MTMHHATPGTCLLPLLLTLPAGAVAGVPLRPRPDHPCLDGDLDAFGPQIRSSGEVRHAVSRPPARMVVEAEGVSPPMLEAALPALRTAGTVVVIRSDDRGWLARVGDLVLRGDDTGSAWLGAAALRGMRCLELLVGEPAAGAEGWLRVPLLDSGGAEAVLSAARAGGIRVRESRIAYG